MTRLCRYILALWLCSWLVTNTFADAAKPVDARANAVARDLFGRVEQVGKPSSHWVWISDAMLSAMPDGRAYLVDADSGRLQGMLNTGYSFSSLTLPRHYREIYAAETYYSRHTRGERTDVVSIYDPAKLTPVTEIVIPTKRASTIPRLYDAALTDDDRFMAVFNLTPAASLSIVDLKERRFVNEILTPGCTMSFPAGRRAFFSLCADGSLLLLQLNDDGTEAGKTKSTKFFDVSQDPILENGVRDKRRWYFTSVRGFVYPVEFNGGSVSFAEPWSLLSEAERNADWQAGGMQHVALHNKQGLLFTLMHQGDSDSYEAAGLEVWVHDITRQKRRRTYKLQRLSASIAVSQDERPLLYVLAAEAAELDVYDAATGTHLRTIGELGLTPAILQPLH